MARPTRPGNTTGVPRARAQGYTYIGLLFFVFLAGLGLAIVGHGWHMDSKRSREQELLFIGEQFRHAIANYHGSAKGQPQYPKALEDLLEDKRHPATLRHLRQIYRDPMTGERDWVLIKEQERIIGISSRSKGKPIKAAGFPERYKDFSAAGTYSDWRFVHRANQEGPEGNPPGKPGTPPGSNPSDNPQDHPLDGQTVPKS